MQGTELPREVFTQYQRPGNTVCITRGSLLVHSRLTDIFGTQSWKNMVKLKAKVRLCAARASTNQRPLFKERESWFWQESRILITSLAEVNYWGTTYTGNNILWNHILWRDGKVANSAPKPSRSRSGGVRHEIRPIRGRCSNNLVPGVIRVHWERGCYSSNSFIEGKWVGLRILFPW